MSKGERVSVEICKDRNSDCHLDRVEGEGGNAGQWGPREMVEGERALDTEAMLCEPAKWT